MFTIARNLLIDSLRRGQVEASARRRLGLEFLRAIDYEFPARAEEYMARMETTLGEAYSEPAADVRGYIASVKP